MIEIPEVWGSFFVVERSVIYMKKSDGKWIPYEILTDTHLSDKKIILSMIIYFNMQDAWCVAWNEYLAYLLNIT